MTDEPLVIWGADDSILVRHGLDSDRTAALVDAATRPARKFTRAVPRVAIAAGVAGAICLLVRAATPRRNLVAFFVLAFLLVMVVGMLLLNVGFAMGYRRPPRRRSHDAMLNEHDDDYVDLSDLPWEHRHRLYDVLERARDRWPAQPP